MGLRLCSGLGSPGRWGIAAAPHSLHQVPLQSSYTPCLCLVGISPSLSSAQGDLGTLPGHVRGSSQSPSYISGESHWWTVDG